MAPPSQKTHYNSPPNCTSPKCKAVAWQCKSTRTAAQETDAHPWPTTDHGYISTNKQTPIGCGVTGHRCTCDAQRGASTSTTSPAPQSALFLAAAAEYVSWDDVCIVADRTRTSQAYSLALEEMLLADSVGYAMGDDPSQFSSNMHEPWSPAELCIPHLTMLSYFAPTYVCLVSARSNGLVLCGRQSTPHCLMWRVHKTSTAAGNVNAPSP